MPDGGLEVSFSCSSVVSYDPLWMDVGVPSMPGAGDHRELTVFAVNKKSVFGTSGMAMARE